MVNELNNYIFITLRLGILCNLTDNFAYFSIKKKHKLKVLIRSTTAKRFK